MPQRYCDEHRDWTRGCENCARINRKYQNEKRRRLSPKAKQILLDRQKARQEKNREYYRLYQVRFRIQRKVNIFSHYSNGDIKCACCGEDFIEFLELDHIMGNGNIHRRHVAKEMGYDYVSHRAPDIYPWIMKNNYPAGFRILCTNCNHSIGFRGYCPHQNTDKHKALLGLLHGTKIQWCSSKRKLQETPTGVDELR